MSINVTVKGNPISIRRGKMVLSDLDIIKKNEREQRKRLRLEQVHEQSRALSKKLLERARRLEQEQLTRLKHDPNTEMKKAHDRRLMEAHRRYQDVENIGYAHENAAKQPDVQSIKRAEEQRNKLMADTRGTDAIQRLQESNKVMSPHSKQIEKLQNVRDLENKRSKMVAQLPRKPGFVNTDVEHISKNENDVPSIKTRKRSSTKSPLRKASKTNKDHSSHTKAPGVTVNDEEQHVVKQGGKQYIYESDDDEPRKIIPVTSTISDKPEKLTRYSFSKEHYQNSSTSDLSEITTTSTSTSSDSTYFSDNAFKTTEIRKTSTHDVSSTKSKINLYDHNTRQRNEYNTPSGLVEKMNMKNQRNADELAEEIKKNESQANAALAGQKDHLKQFSQDAILREKAKKDYEALVKQLDQFSKEERKLKANQISSSANKQVLPPSVLAEKQLKRQKRMDRVFENILSASRNPTSTNFQVERPITITPRDYIHSQTAPATVWRESPYIGGPELEESSEDDRNYHHKRKIFELLTNVDKLKRTLLEEYGTDLPDCVFNASVKSLFHPSSTSTSQEKLIDKKIDNNMLKPKATEIQVTNKPNGDETIKPTQKTINKNKKVKNNQTPGRALLKKSSIQNTVSTRDQQVQVEFIEDKKKDQIPSTPLEPVVKIKTPKNMEASNNTCSDSSTTTDLLVDVSKKEITVIPKERESSVKISKDGLAVSSVKSSRCSTTNTPVKISFDQQSGNQSFELIIDPNKKEITFLPKKRKTEVASKKLSPISSEKYYSLPGSRTSSPVKKLSRSAPPSRHCSPKKNYLQTKQRQEQIHFEGQRYKSRCTQVSINSSTESSQFNSTSENLNDKFHNRFRALATKRIISKLTDTSDTSTTYASPPTTTPGALLSAINSSTPILELLDSSINESMKNQRIQVSPVSSPETPSPRTMRLPSNIPKSNQVCKSLKYTSLVNTQTKPGSNLISKSTRTTYSTTKEKPALTKLKAHNKQCTCKNPACKLLHEQIEDTQAYATKNCPEVLKKLEDLQTGCMERIASLTDLIEKVRNEQKGFELSVVTNEDSNSASQVIANSQGSTNGDVGKVVKNVEALYAQLRRTLLESKKIISGEEIEFPKSIVPYNTIEKSPSLSFDFSKDTTTSGSVEMDAETAKGVAIVAGSSVTPKPMIVSDEKVKIKLARFRPPQLSKYPSKIKETCRSKVASETSTVEMMTNTSNQNCDMVEKLSQEILEQSKSINKSVPVDSIKNSDDSLLKLSQVAVKDSAESSKNNASNEETNQSTNLEVNASEYIPLLAGIPKIIRTKGSANGRGRPPVTLTNVPYRQDIDSPAHELSTIVEFDTPDTVNKSQISSRSPSSKCRRKLPIVETAQTTSSSPSKKPDVKSTESKPSVRVCPFLSYQSPPASVNLSSKSITKSVEKSLKKSTEMTLDSLEKKEVLQSETKKSEFSNSMYSLSDVQIDQLQNSYSNAGSNYDCRISQISELHSLPDETIEQMMISEIREESKSISVTPVQRHSETQEQEKEKVQLSSTSTASFSGLSGVVEITSTQSSEKNFKCPSSPEEMELALKNWGLGWAIPTLKKTREASALGSSSSSEVTPVNTGTRLVSPAKKHQDGAGHELSHISDVSSISIKNANKSTERSVLVKGRTSTPNRLSNTNSDGTVSTLSSFTSDLNIVIQNQSADITIPNISFSNDKFV